MIAIKIDFDKAKNRQAHLGRKHTEISKKKMSEQRRGENNSFFGKHWDEKNRKRLSKNMAEYIRVYGHPKGMLGKKHSENFKRELSERNKDDNNPMAKRVIFNGKIYNTIKAVCEATGLTRYRVTRCFNNPAYSKDNFRILE